MTVAAPVHPAFEHVALFHEGTQQLADHLAPHLLQATADGDAVLVCLELDTWDALRRLIGRKHADVQFIPAGTRYSRPPVAMATVHRFVTDSMAAGAPAVWSIGAIPFDGRSDQQWLRYEASVDSVLGHLPLHAICTYDVASCSDELLHGARCTHGRSLSADGPDGHDVEPLVPIIVPAIRLPDEAPVVDTVVDTAARARDAISRSLGRHVVRDRLKDLLLVVSELTTNALVHGAPPVRLSAWAAPGRRAVVRVSDCGPGIADPYVELRQPRMDQVGGRGMWLVGQLVDQLSVERRDATTTVTICYPPA